MCAALVGAWLACLWAVTLLVSSRRGLHLAGDGGGWCIAVTLPLELVIYYGVLFGNDVIERE